MRRSRKRNGEAKAVVQTRNDGGQAVVTATGRRGFWRMCVGHKATMAW